MLAVILVDLSLKDSVDFSREKKFSVDLPLILLVEDLLGKETGKNSGLTPMERTNIQAHNARTRKANKSRTLTITI